MLLTDADGFRLVRGGTLFDSIRYLRDKQMSELHEEMAPAK